MDLSDRRKEYTKHALTRADLLADPIEQFKLWFDQAEELQLDEPNAMCVASVGSGGQPSTRIVLLKGISEGGFVFYTNYESRKASELDANPKVAANFFWLPLQRQVNITGKVERVSKAESLKYFLTRPLGSRLGAWTSPQSKVISSRQILEAKFEQMKRKFADGKVPLPDDWGGYRIVPETIEFWQGGASRLHDRFIYSKNEAGHWIVERLAP
ncbi:MAG: pyridoxamine 5'-phosphate oxidase [Coraliomargarita sp.]